MLTHPINAQYLLDNSGLELIDTSENNFGINQELTKYWKESCGLDLYQHTIYSENCFFREISANSQVVLGATGMNGLTHLEGHPEHFR